MSTSVCSAMHFVTYRVAILLLADYYCFSGKTCASTLAHGGDEDAAQHLDVDELDRMAVLARRVQPRLRQEVHYEQRSGQLLAHAREQKMNKMKSKQLVEKDREKEVLQQQLDAVREAFPGVARSCDIRAPRRTGIVATVHEMRKDSMTDTRASKLLIAVFQDKIPRGLGVKHERLLLFTSDLLKKGLEHGMLAFLEKCVEFRKNSDAQVKNTVHLGYSHESDGTRQMISQRAIQAVGRPSAARLGCEVINQRGYFRAMLMSVDRTDNSIVLKKNLSEQIWTAHSCVILAKTAPFILKSLQIGMPFDQLEENWEGWKLVLDAAADSFCLEQIGDKGTNVMPAKKHVAAQFSEIPMTLNDLSNCEIHVLNTLKNLVPGIKPIIGKLFCFGNIGRDGSYVSALISIMQYMAHSVKRLVGLPPAEIKDDMRRLIEALYKPDAEHHKRSKGKKKSYLVEDLDALEKMTLYPLPGQAVDRQHMVRVHWCWDEAKQAPCCRDEEETREKASTSQINFHASSAMEKVTMSRFTNCGKARKRLLIGMTSERFFMSASVFAMRRSVDPSAPFIPTLPAMGVRAEELGAYDSCMQQTMKTRCGRSCSWFASREIQYELPITETVENIADLLQYEFFGCGAWQLVEPYFHTFNIC